MNAMRTRKLVRLAASLLTAATLAAPIALAPAVASAEVPKVRKLAMVDMQRVLNETKAGKHARKKLESASKSKQAKLDKRRRKLEADRDYLARLSPILDLWILGRTVLWMLGRRGCQRGG